MIMIVISFALVKFYAFAILYVLIVMQIKLVVVCCLFVENENETGVTQMTRDNLKHAH